MSGKKLSFHAVVSRDSFTLLELLIAIVIIGILATLGFSQYLAARERAFSREAIVGLRAIYSAQKIYQSEFTDYYGPENNLGLINSNLRLELNERNWDYEIIARGINPDTFTATATRQGGVCVYTVDEGETITAGPNCFSVD